LLSNEPMERPMKRDDLRRSLVAVSGVKRQPLEKQKPDRDGLLALLARWRGEAIKAGHTINRVVVAFEAVMRGSGSRGGHALEK
jgi:hypothetical protein